MSEQNVGMARFALPESFSSTFKEMDSETVYAGSIFAVRHDHVCMPGGSIATRDVVENFGAVAVVALDDEENVTLVEQYRYPLNSREWELPAGLLDIKSEDPRAGAERELAEEAGLTADRWEVLLDLVTSPGFSDESVRIYLARGLTPIPRPELEDNEESEIVLALVPLHEAVAAIFSGQINNAIAVCGLLTTRYALDAEHEGKSVLRPSTAPWTSRPTRFTDRRSSAST